MAIEIHKVKLGLFPPLKYAMSMQLCNYDFHGNKFLEIPRVKSVRSGTESVLFLDPKVWKILPKTAKLFKFLKQR